MTQSGDSGPLVGRTVVITRPRAQAASLVEALERHGAHVMAFPTIQVEPVADPAPIDRAIDRLVETDWVIFTSVNGVEMFGERLRKRGDGVDALARCHIATIGPATADSLRALGIEPERVPQRYLAEGLLEALGDQEWSGQRVLIPRAARAREVLPDDLRRQGADVDVLPVYHTIRPATDPEPLRRALASRGVAAVTFTSSSTVTGFESLFDEGEAVTQVREAGAAVACIGPITAATARDVGFTVDVEAGRFTVEGLVEALLAYFSGLPAHVNLRPGS